MERFGLVDWVAKDAFKTLNQLLWDVIKFLLRWELKHLKILAIRFDWLAKWWVKTWNRLESLHHRCQMGSSDDQECDDGKRKTKQQQQKNFMRLQILRVGFIFYHRPGCLRCVRLLLRKTYLLKQWMFYVKERWRHFCVQCAFNSIGRMDIFLLSSLPLAYDVSFSLSLSLSGSMCVCFFLNRICFVCRTDVLVAFNLMSSSVFISKRKPE